MRKCIHILLVLLLLTGCSGSRRFTIVLEGVLSDTLSLAVNDLESYILESVPGAKVGRADIESEKGNVIRIVRNGSLGWNSYRISSTSRDNGCYVYTLEGADIWGLQYAVYDLAERLLGVQYLKPEQDYITVQRHFRASEINTGIQSPDYRWRGLYPWHYNYNSRGLKTFCDINRHFVDGDWDWYKRLCDWMIKNRQNAVLWFDDVFSHENISGQFPAHVQDYFALRGIRQILGMGWASNEDLQSKDAPLDRPYCLNSQGKSVEDAAWKRNICPMIKEYFPLADINFSRMDISRPDNYLGCLIGYGENGWAAKEAGTDCVLHKGIPSSTLMMRDYRYIRSKLDKAGLADIPLGFVTSTWSIHPGNPFETDAFLDALPEGSIFTMHTYQQTDWPQFRRLYDQIARKNKGFKVFHIAEVAFLCGTDIPLFRPGILSRRENHFKTLPRENTIGHLATLNTTQYLYWLSTWQEMRWQWSSDDTRYSGFYPEILQKLLFLENGSSSPWRRYSRDSHPAGFGFLLWAGEKDREKLQEAEACLDSVLELDRQLVKAGDRLYIMEFSPSVRLTANYYGIRIYCGLRDYDMAIECLEEYNRIFTEEMGMTPDSDFVENPDISYLENLKTKIQ